MPTLREVVREASQFSDLEFNLLEEVFRRSLKYERVPIKVLSKALKMKEEKIIKLSTSLHSIGLLEYFGQPYPSVRLQTLGADVLALHKLAKRGLVEGLGRQIGVGKESDVYEVFGGGERYILKIFRLGRVSFRQVRRLRTYGRIDIWRSWLYRNISAAKIELNILRKLFIRGMPVPRPVYGVMHTVLMEYLDGYLLKDVDVSDSVKEVFEEIIEAVYTIYSGGIVNGDISEYNVFVLTNGEVRIIDWPQAVNVSDPRAEMLLTRDITTISKYFIKKYGFPVSQITAVLSRYGFEKYLALE